jgi:hypothetical protein
MHEEASFALFTHSFETLSETGNYLREMGLPPDGRSSVSPSNALDPRTAKHHSRPPRKIDVTIGAHSPSESSVAAGDISPIKLVNHEERDRHGHSDPFLNVDFRQRSSPHPRQIQLRMPREQVFASPRLPLMPYGIRTQSNAYDLTQDERCNTLGRTGPQEPNPFFVLRAVRGAFHCCSYLLSCLSEAEVCPINLSHYGKIRHYREVSVQLSPVTKNEMRVSQKFSSSFVFNLAW